MAIKTSFKALDEGFKIEKKKVEMMEVESRVPQYLENDWDNTNRNCGEKNQWKLKDVPTYYYTPS